jgi:hypothetical protein
VRKLVVIESPYAGDVRRNRRYAQDALMDCLSRGEAPLASHLLYTQVLDDHEPGERHRGIMSGLAWSKHAELVAVYTDLGISTGMKLGIEAAKYDKIPIEYRTLRDWSKP